MAFAKLYEKDNDQLLIKIDNGDDGPEVRFFFEPEGLGVCSIALSWKDKTEDEAWDRAEELFDKMTEGTAWEIVKKTKNELEKMVD